MLNQPQAEKHPEITVNHQCADAHDWEWVCGHWLCRECDLLGQGEDPAIMPCLYCGAIVQPGNHLCPRCWEAEMLETHPPEKVEHIIWQAQGGYGSGFPPPGLDTNDRLCYNGREEATQ